MDEIFLPIETNKILNERDQHIVANIMGKKTIKMLITPSTRNFIS